MAKATPVDVVRTPKLFEYTTYDASYKFEEQVKQVKITKRNRSGEERVLFISHDALLTYVAHQIVAPQRRLNASNGLHKPIDYLVKDG